MPVGCMYSDMVHVAGLNREVGEEKKRMLKKTHRTVCLGITVALANLSLSSASM